MVSALAALVVAACVQPYLVPDAEPGAPTFITTAGLDPVGGCITAGERAQVRDAIARLTILNFTTATPPDLGQTSPFTFFPMAGRLNNDTFLIQSTDLNPELGEFFDAHCSSATYDNHSGLDAIIRSFDEQGPHASAEGTPVFAALDGVVIYAIDASPDRNVSCAGSANAVVLSHSGGERTFYWHLKRGSVRHAVGDTVRAGEQIGLVGSSGCSAWPHLHFETQVNNARVETLRGPCHVTSTPYWSVQPPIAPSDMHVLDVGLTSASLVGRAPPRSYPRSSHVALTDERLSAWITLLNVPTNAQACTMLRRPDGSLAWQSSMTVMREPGVRLAALHAEWPIESLESTPGVWRVQWIVEAAFRADLPFTVLPERDPSFNRAPNPISVSMTPLRPTGDEPIVCEVGADAIFDDPDYDVVRFEYVWTIDGVEARRVTSYARSDVLAAGSASSFQTVRCVVTPMDDTVLGVAAEAEVTTGLPCAAQARPLGTLSPAAVHAVLSGGEGSGGSLPDLDRNGRLDLTDLALLLSSFGTGCPD